MNLLSGHNTFSKLKLFFIKSSESLQNMKTNGFIVTGPGKMMCGRILHIKARSKASKWEETVKTCLKTVEDKGGNSISFLALGTGK